MNYVFNWRNRLPSMKKHVSQLKLNFKTHIFVMGLSLEFYLSLKFIFIENL